MKQPLTRDSEGVRIEVMCEPETIPIKGNAMASGDDDVDRKVEEEIQRQLDQGNEWAWCSVAVSATWEEFAGVVYLGGCSYEDKLGFIEGSGYHDDMVREALAELNKEVQEAHAKLMGLVGDIPFGVPVSPVCVIDLSNEEHVHRLNRGNGQEVVAIEIHATDKHGSSVRSVVWISIAAVGFQYSDDRGLTVFVDSNSPSKTARFKINPARIGHVIPRDPPNHEEKH